MGSQLIAPHSPLNRAGAQRLRRLNIPSPGKYVVARPQELPVVHVAILKLLPCLKSWAISRVRRGRPGHRRRISSGSVFPVVTRRALVGAGAAGLSDLSSRTRTCCRDTCFRSIHVILCIE